MTTTTPSEQPSTPAEALRQCVALFDPGPLPPGANEAQVEVRNIARMMTRWADELDAAPVTYALPAEPPVGTHLWNAGGQEYKRTSNRTFGWVTAGVALDDPRYERCSWTGVLKGGPLSTTPPTTEEAPMPTTDLTTPATTLMRDLFEASTVYLARATRGYVESAPSDRAAADAFAEKALVGLYAGAAARLLHALMQQDPDVCGAVASQLHEWMQFGEPLAEWVGEQAAKYGIDTEEASTR